MDGVLLLGLLLCWAAPVLGDDGGAPCHPIRIEAAVICAELAATDAEVRQGLMGRTRLAPDAGMLFIYARPRRLSFWMKDTLLSLDIGFFDAAGVLQEIHPLVPLDLRSVVSRGDGMEVPRGGFARAGLEIGARMDLGSVDAALKARGFAVSVQPPPAAPPLPEEWTP
jgi:uncharacterized membrane protein (UPF0127 family)